MSQPVDGVARDAAEGGWGFIKLDLLNKETKSAAEPDNNKSLDCGTKQNYVCGN